MAGPATRTKTRGREFRGRAPENEHSEQDGGDELLRIISGFGNDFKQTRSTPVQSTKEGDLDAFTILFSVPNLDRIRSEMFCALTLTMSTLLGYRESTRATLIWVQFLIALCILSYESTLASVSAYSLSTGLIMVLYLPLRRGLPKALRLACATSIRHGAPAECDTWFRGSMIFLIPSLVILTAYFIFGVGLLARLVSGSTRNVVEVERYARYSVLWLWAEPFVDILLVHMGSKDLTCIRAVDVLMFLILPPLLMTWMLKSGLGIVGIPIGLALSHGLRLASAIVVAWSSEELPQLFPSSSNQWRQIPSRERSIQSTSSDNTYQDPVLGTCLATSILGKNVGYKGFIATWRNGFPLILGFLFAWSLGSASMVAHSFLLGLVYILLSLCGHPGFSMVTEKRIRHFIARGQGGGALKSARWGLVWGFFTSFAISVVTGVTLSTQNIDQYDGDSRETWRQATGAALPVSLFIFLSSVVSILRSLLRGVKQKTLASIAMHVPRFVSVGFCYAFAIHLEWGVSGIWYGMVIGATASLIACGSAWALAKHI